MGTISTRGRLCAVRDWLKSTPNHQWTLPQEVVDRTAALYEEAYELLTGSKLS